MPTNDDGQVIPFATILQQVQKGAAHQRVSESLADLVAAVLAHDKAGTLNITVKVEPIKGAGTLAVSVTCATKAPQPTETGIFFGDDEGRLTRHDPRQTQVNLAVVGTAREGETA